MKFHITYDTDTATLISASDLVITDYSNVGVEAILLNKPLITVNFAKEEIYNVQKYHEYNASVYIDEYVKLEDLVMKISNGKDILEILQEGRNRLIPRYNFHNDGKATLRVIDLLLKREN
jgi:CDP-glycerol glycerophosphotransferase (TagB/SpsB family)